MTPEECEDCDGQGCLGCNPQYMDVDVLVYREIRNVLMSLPALPGMSTEYIGSLLEKLPEDTE